MLGDRERGLVEECSAFEGCTWGGAPRYPVGHGVRQRGGICVRCHNLQDVEVALWVMTGYDCVLRSGPCPAVLSCHTPGGSVSGAIPKGSMHKGPTSHLLPSSENAVAWC